MLPTQILENEHEVIKKALYVLKIISDLLEKGKEIDIQDVLNLIDFFRTFADKCHHGKEEDLLFVEMEKAGIPNEGGPIGQMLIEHNEGREYVKEMLASISENYIDRERFINNAIRYIDLLSTHIDKENNILYPLGNKFLSEKTQNILLEKFEEFEKNVIQEGVHEKFHHLIDELYEKYRR
jgi:hemerythrin-like domain-containing protein